MDYVHLPLNLPRLCACPPHHRAQLLSAALLLLLLLALARGARADETGGGSIGFIIGGQYTAPKTSTSEGKPRGSKCAETSECEKPYTCKFNLLALGNQCSD